MAPMSQYAYVSHMESRKAVKEREPYVCRIILAVNIDVMLVAGETLWRVYVLGEGP